MKKSLNKGFTLIELLVVIAIIGILSSVVLVSLSGARTKANAAKATSDMSQVMTAVEMALSDGCSTVTTGATTGVQCTPPGGSLTTYMAKLPVAASNFTYTIGASLTSSYSISASGFANSQTFTCSGGTCTCSVANGCTN